MAETHETIADIIAEKRRQADEIERDVAEKMKRNAMISDRYARELVADIRREADRLEAAHRRELSKNVSKNGADFGQLGDAAKLREALKAIIGLCAGLMPTWDGAVGRIKDMAEAALAVPPRNCDRYETADEALKAQEQMFNNSNFANGECKLGCPECDNPRVGCKIAWLFAPAAEKEGGAK